MKITAIKPVLADGGHRIFIFVKVETDQPGLVGWGEASLEEFGPGDDADKVRDQGAYLRKLIEG